MPQIAQQDYKVIAPKDERAFINDATALAELKKSVLNGIAFDCLLKNINSTEGTLDRIFGIYEDGSKVTAYDTGNEEAVKIDLPYTITQYQGLATVQEAEDSVEFIDYLPRLSGFGGHLSEDNGGYPITVNGFYLTPTEASGVLAALEISTEKPAEGSDFINITWEDALKLIGLPLV